MNFFEQQDLAQRNTKRLIALLCLAVLSLITITTLLVTAFYYFSEMNNNRYLQESSLWEGFISTLNWKMFGGISIAVCGIIFLGSLYKLFQLSGGGRTVAEAMGGHLLNAQSNDADERKILNVVEEMAIASGSPVPPVYLIEDEAINAFAAGHTPQDAIIGITRGCIKLLNRDELQGVIAHEFSHIHHGDMTLNMRLIALLNGILLLGLLGEFLMRSTNTRLTSRSSKDKFPIAILGLGIGLIVIGYTGTFFGNLIKSAVSRQREFLADASAVKFTRNPDGIAGALKKIGGYFSGSRLQNDHAAEFSHLFFSAGINTSFIALMATHPPLEERIKRIEPRWDGNFPPVKYTTHHNTNNNNGSNDDSLNESLHGFAAQNETLKDPIEYVINVDQVLQSIGQPTAAHIAYAQQTLTSIDEKVHDAAHNPWEAQALMLGLLLDKDPTKQAQQWALLTPLFSSEQISFLKAWALHAFKIAPQLRLPLLELALPALKQLSPSQYQTFKQALTFFIHEDKHIHIMEWSYCRILTHNLEPKKPRSQQFNLQDLQQEACTLLSIIAYAGANSIFEAQAAFNGSKIIIQLDRTTILDKSACSMMNLDLAIARLNNLKPLQKPKLLKAIHQCVLHDQKITIAEAELFRAIADGLDCPIPPIIISSN